MCTRQIDHQLVTVVLHALHEGVDGFQPKAVLFAAVQAVGLVDEQHAAECTLDDAVGQRGGMARVAAHQVAAAHLHQLAALERPMALRYFATSRAMVVLPVPGCR